MAVTQVGVTTGSAEFTSITLSSHASTLIGDRLVAVCFRDEGYGTDTWTGTPFTMLGELAAGTSPTTGGRVQVWYGTASANGATSYTYSGSSSSTGTAHLFTLRGAAAGAPTMATANNGSSLSQAAPSVGAGTLDFEICAWDARSVGGARTWTVPGAMTTAGQINPNSTYIVTVAASAASIAAGAQTATLNTASPTLAVSVAVSAAATVAGPPSDVRRRRLRPLLVR